MKAFLKIRFINIEFKILKILKLECKSKTLVHKNLANKSSYMTNIIKIVYKTVPF